MRAHKKFKTAVVILGPGPLGDGQRIDVATARLEYYEHPAALPTVELSSIKMDLFRRDFTINALALELNPDSFGRLVDFFGGQKDIKDRIIRVLHSLSFVEDPTRILRAIRFEQRFTFRIGGQTERLIKNAVKLNMFHKLSGSRVFQELKLILEEKNPLACLVRMEKFGVLQSIHPLLKLDPTKERILQEMDKVISWYRLLYLEQDLEAWKTTQKLIDWQDEKDAPLSELYFILSPIPVEGVLYVMARSRKESTKRAISKFLTRLRDQKPDIGGSDLVEMGVPTGPVYSHILNRVLAAKIDGAAPGRKEQLALAQTIVKQLREESREAREGDRGGWFFTDTGG